MKIASLFVCLSISVVLSGCASGTTRATPPQPPPVPTYRVISEDGTSVAFEAGPPWLIVDGQDHVGQLILQHATEPNGVLVVFIADAPFDSTIEEMTADWWGLMLLMPNDLFTITEKTAPIAISDEESSFTFLGTAKGRAPGGRGVVDVPITADARIRLVSDNTHDAWIMVWTMSPTAMAAAMAAEAARVIKTLRIDSPE